MNSEQFKAAQRLDRRAVNLEKEIDRLEKSIKFTEEHANSIEAEISLPETEPVMVPVSEVRSLLVDILDLKREPLQQIKNEFEAL